MKEIKDLLKSIIYELKAINQRLDQLQYPLFVYNPSEDYKPITITCDNEQSPFGTVDRA